MNEVLNTEGSLQNLEQLGRIFRKQRKKKSLSIQEVSETLRIGEKILNGIEEGNVDEKIAPVFMRGFIRSYAKHLDLWDEAIEQSVSESSRLEKDRINQTFPRKPVSSTESHFIRNLAAVLVLIGAGYLLYVLFLIPDPVKDEFPVAKISSREENIIILQAESPKLSEEETNKSMGPKTETVMMESEPKTLADSSPTGEEFQSETSIPSELPEAEEPMTGSLVTVSQESKPAGHTPILSENEPIESTEAPGQVSEPLPPPPMQLIISSTERAWFAILMDDQEIMDVMLNAGESYELEAHERFLVTLGNTAALHLMFDGREIEFDRRKSLLTDWLIEANPSE